MKKIFTLFGMMALSGAVLTMNAQNVYISGAFNDYNPEGADEYQLIQGDSEDDEGDTYTIYINIPEGEFSFNFIYDDNYLVPADEDTALTENINVPVGENVFSFVSVASDNSIYWVNEEWVGGEVGILLNLDEKTVTIKAEEESAYDWYIRGVFNDYNPGKSAEWALLASEDVNANGDVENGIYVGTFEVPEGELSFNFLSSSTGWVYIPSKIMDEEIVFTNDVYKTSMDYAFNDDESAYTWSDPTWEGGAIAISLNAENGAVTITKVKTDKVDWIGSELNNVDAIYNMQGMRISNPVKGNIYIINGKKVLF